MVLVPGLEGGAGSGTRGGCWLGAEGAGPMGGGTARRYRGSWTLFNLAGGAAPRSSANVNKPCKDEQGRKNRNTF